MKIKAEVLADSKNEFGNRITTMIVTFPRIILAEFNTHRMFSRNSASSRAIPFEKMVKSVEENPFIPIAWQKDHKGMQGSEYITDNNTLRLIKDEWLIARDAAVLSATRLHSGKIASDDNIECDIVTKQLCNRLLEPFMWHTVIVTATEWENFFALRCPQYNLELDGESIFRSKKNAIKVFKNANAADYSNKSNLWWLQLNKGQAEIHMMALAEAMWDAYNESTPKELNAGEWHIPFGDDIDIEKLKEAMFHDHSIEDSDEPTEEEINKYKVAIATTRCARVSYTVIGEDQKPLTYQRMVEIHDTMLAANPKHMSPFEHCAKAMAIDTVLSHDMVGNFRGFIQYRKMFKNENIIKVESE